MTPQEQVRIVQWAREQERNYGGGLTGGHITSPFPLTLGETFKTLADCAAVGVALKMLADGGAVEVGDALIAPPPLPRCAESVPPPSLTGELASHQVMGQVKHSPPLFWAATLLLVAFWLAPLILSLFH